MTIFMSFTALVLQGQVAGFDAVPSEYRMSWESKLFVLYLLTAFVITLGKSLSLARRLWRFSAKQRDGEVSDARLLAVFALTNRLYLPHRDWEIPSRRHKSEISLHLLPQARLAFRYAWDTCSANVAFLKRLMVLTLLSSILVLAYGTTTILLEVANQKITGGVFWSGSMAEVLALFVLGVSACVLIHAVTSLYEGTLTQRRVLWDYFCSTVESHGVSERK